MSATSNNSDVYSPARAAELFGLAESRLRYWAQTGFVGPSVRRGGRFFYTFPDLVALKVAKDLLDRGVSMQRVRKNLDALRARLPAVERPLSQLRICSDGDELLVVDDGVAFQPTSGQLVMSFAVSSIQDRLGEPGAEERLAVVRPITPPVPVPIEPEKTEPDSAWRAFQAGLAAADAGEPARAAQCYRRALELDPAFAAAHTNLGNAEEAAGHRGLARAAYEKALELDPDQTEARYNLANLHADLGETELALAEYRRVVAAKPSFADAHHNLALVLLRVGAVAQARAHLEQVDSDDARTLIARLA